MTTLEQVREMAMRLPGVSDREGEFGFTVLNSGKQKGFAHLWRERVHPTKTKVPNPGVLVLVVANLEVKEAILASDSRKFFTEPHYDGYAAILVRLAEIEPEELRGFLKQAWRCKAPSNQT